MRRGNSVMYFGKLNKLARVTGRTHLETPVCSSSANSVMAQYRRRVANNGILTLFFMAASIGRQPGQAAPLANDWEKE